MSKYRHDMKTYKLEKAKYDRAMKEKEREADKKH